MSQFRTDERRKYHVVVNDDGLYSIWADGRTPPEGWQPEGAAGTKQECLAHITHAWTQSPQRHR